jgi:hypothetical protein
MDNKMIFMIVLAIVLGMLVANMFKEVCGCKNLIEGQTCAQGGGCRFTLGVRDEGTGEVCPSNAPPEACEDTYSSDIGGMQASRFSRRPDSREVTGLRPSSSYWKDTVCCALNNPVQQSSATVTIGPDGCIRVGAEGAAPDEAATGCPGLEIENSERIVAPGPACQHPIQNPDSADLPYNSYKRRSVATGYMWTEEPATGSAGNSLSCNSPGGVGGETWNCSLCGDSTGHDQSARNPSLPQYGNFCQTCCMEDPRAGR